MKLQRQDPISGDINKRMKTPGIAVNRSGVTSGNPYEAFAVFEVEEDEKNYQNNCQSSSGVDTWLDNPIDLKGSSSYRLYHPSVTYRAFGNDYVFQVLNEANVYMNDQALDTTSGDKMSVKTKTNTNNQKDVFTSYSQGEGEDCKIMIRQVHP